MDDALLVGHLQRAAQLFADGQGHRQRELAPDPDQLFQGRALDVLHGEVIRTVHLAEVVRPHHVAVGDLARQPDLLLEALQGDPVAREGFGTERLDGHRLLQLAVERAIDHAHPARPQDLLHFVPIGEQGPGPE